MKDWRQELQNEMYKRSDITDKFNSYLNESFKLMLFQRYLYHIYLKKILCLKMICYCFITVISQEFSVTESTDAEDSCLSDNMQADLETAIHFDADLKQTPSETSNIWFFFWNKGEDHACLHMCVDERDLNLWKSENFPDKMWGCSYLKKKKKNLEWGKMNYIWIIRKEPKIHNKIGLIFVPCGRLPCLCYACV